MLYTTQCGHYRIVFYTCDPSVTGPPHIKPGGAKGHARPPRIPGDWVLNRKMPPNPSAPGCSVPAAMLHIHQISHFIREASITVHHKDSVSTHGKHRTISLYTEAAKRSDPVTRRNEVHHPNTRLIYRTPSRPGMT